MIKILSAKQIRETDAFTIQEEPIASIDLMERACMAFCEVFMSLFSAKFTVSVFAGKGNNGGDALGIARLLILAGYKVTPYVVSHDDLFSADFMVNKKRLEDLTCVYSVHEDTTLEPGTDIIIDGIFGSGLNRAASGLYARTINSLNESNARIIAIDIPSGLFADDYSEGPVIKADTTISFQSPKLSFFLPEYQPYTGRVHVVDIGLHVGFIGKMESRYYQPETGDISKMLVPRGKTSHKGIYGHALLVGGSKGKMGAIVLSSRAALRCGLGLLTCHVPNCGYNILQTAFPEAMVLADAQEDYLSNLPDISPYSALGLGPGMGQHPDTKEFLHSLLLHRTQPLVIDADAINLLSSNRELLALLPENCIITPHPGEFKRLAGAWANDFERLHRQRDLSIKHKIIIVLKGSHTSISDPSGNIFFNSTGNNGMATAGSGDVLTGVITSFLAQGLTPLNAALTGVYLHGLAGDIAAENIGFDGLIASDLIQALPTAIMKVRNA